MLWRLLAPSLPFFLSFVSLWLSSLNIQQSGSTLFNLYICFLREDIFSKLFCFALLLNSPFPTFSLLAVLLLFYSTDSNELPDTKPQLLVGWIDTWCWPDQSQYPTAWPVIGPMNKHMTLMELISYRQVESSTLSLLLSSAWWRHTKMLLPAILSTTKRKHLQEVDEAKDQKEAGWETGRRKNL